MKVTSCVIGFLACATVSSRAAEETNQLFDQDVRRLPGNEKDKQKGGQKNKPKKAAAAKDCKQVGDELKCRLDPADLQLDDEEIDVVPPKATQNEYHCKRGRPTKNKKAWHGECDGDMSDVNVVVHKDKKGKERVFGSLHVGKDVCRIHPNADGTDGEIDCQPQDSFLLEDAPHAGDDDNHKRGLRGDSKNTTYHYGMKLADPSRRRLFDDSGSTIDIMVLWTKEAECQNSGQSKDCTPNESTEDNIMGVIELALEETNTAFAESGINSELRLVHSYRHPDYVEPTTNTFGTAVDDLRNIGDGELEDVHAKRELYGADMVAMIMGTYTSCGIAYVGPAKRNTFSLSHYSCATGYYSFGHELAHNLGAYHDRGTVGVCGTDGYKYGWRDPDTDFRTIMAYNCQPGQCDNMPETGCTRIQRFSNPTYLYNGKALGDTFNDNARQLNEQLATVAGHYPAMDCELDSECDDGQAGTEDTCNTEARVCVFTEVPTPNPSSTPSLDPSSVPTSVPTMTPSSAPSTEPSSIPSAIPTDIPSVSPSASPTNRPSMSPTGTPSLLPSEVPSVKPSASPSSTPSTKPSTSPSSVPSVSPSVSPSAKPSVSPSATPSLVPSSKPSTAPSFSPSSSPSMAPTKIPTRAPATFAPVNPRSEVVPTASPTTPPSAVPSSKPSSKPSDSPSASPSGSPTSSPSGTPSATPSQTPSSSPTGTPSATPSRLPTSSPSHSPSSKPSSSPSGAPSTTPSRNPSSSPSGTPSASPSRLPTLSPTLSPSLESSESPSGTPSQDPTLALSLEPSPSEVPIYIPPGGNDVDPHMESIRVTGVDSESWTTVHYEEAFGSPVAVCTIDYGDGWNMKPAVVRMDNVGPKSFDVRIQNPGDVEKLDSCDLHCVVVEEGKWQLPNGRRIEAQSYLSTKTNGQMDWDGETQKYMQKYRNPVVLGQVMSYNDDRWSTFYSTGRKRNHMARRVLKTGMHVGQDPDFERKGETIGFIVMDPVHIRTRGGIEFEAYSGPRRVRGYTQRWRWPYRFRQRFQKTPKVIVLSQAAMSCPEGSWGVLAGQRADAKSFGIAVDEDQLGDLERWHHMFEPMDYIAFGDTGTVPLLE